MSHSNPPSHLPTRTPSPQPPLNQDGYTSNGRPTSQILSNRQSLALPLQQPNTVGTTSTARFSTGGMFGISQPGVTSGQSLRNDGGVISSSGGNSDNVGQQQQQQQQYAGAGSYANERPLNTANRHVSLAAGMGGGSGSTSNQGMGIGGIQQQQQQQGQGNGNVGDRLANARAVSPRLPGSAGPGSNQFPTSYAGGTNGLLAGSSSTQGLGGLGLGAAPGGRSGAGIRPASEYLGGGNRGQRGKEASPENEAIENWFTDLQAYEAQLDALASASMDQNFTDELQAIESWFRVLSENERTAALYSLLQQSTTAQVRFFQKVLSQMSQSDPVSALLSPALGSSMQNQQEGSRLGATPNLGGMGGLRSPGLSTSAGFPSSPQVNQFLAPDAAVSQETFGSPSAQLAAQRNRMKQNRISAPGTLQVSEAGRFLGGQLNDVIERGSSPGVDSNASRSPAMGATLGAGMDSRPKSTDFAGMANVAPGSRSPRPNNNGNSGMVGLGLPNTGLKSPRFEDQFSPMLQGNWASLMNTPMMPMFGDNNGQNMSQADLAAALGSLGIGGLGQQHGGNIVLDDAAKFKRRPQNAVVYNDDGEPIPQQQQQHQTRLESPRPGAGFQAGDWRSPMTQQGEFASNAGLQGLAGLGLAGGMGGIGLDAGNLAGLGMGMGMGIGMGMANISPNPMLNSTGFAGSPGMWGQGNRARSQTERPRKSPLLRQGEKPGAGGGAGAGAGVAGENDVDERVLKDVAYWLRVLRLHKYTPNFQGEKWQDIVSMNDAKLQDMGVAALGARRKLLKVFANVRSHYKIPHPEGYLEELGTDDKDGKDKDGDDQAETTADKE